MSSYKEHSIFALLLACMFFHSPLLIALTIIGANIPDFDHKFKKDNVYKMIILGLIMFISFYILKLPYYIGLIVIFLGVTFYFSEHRSFTHSLFGILILAAAVSLILIWGLQLITTFTIVNEHYMILAVLIVLLGFLFLNKKLLMIFLPIFFICLFIVKAGDFTYIEIVVSLFLGLLSHIVLDSFTSSGIKLFAPLSSKKVYKSFGLIMIFILVILSIMFHASELFKIFEMYIQY